jgi:hypothetical protein
MHWLFQQMVPAPQLPQLPPQPLFPQILPSQLGTHTYQLHVSWPEGFGFAGGTTQLKKAYTVSHPHS